VATLVIPSDCAWGDAPMPTITKVSSRSTPVSTAAIDAAAALLRSDGPTALLIGGAALLAPGLQAAARIAQKTGAVIMSQTFDARFTRGAGLPVVKRLPYFPEKACKRLSGYSKLVLAGTTGPTAFFAYPDRSTALLPAGCETTTLAAPEHDVVGALEALAEAVGAAGDLRDSRPFDRPAPPQGALTAESAGASLGALLPENAIVSDESGTSGEFAYRMTAGAPPHDWLCLTGGSIGQGVPLATGAALACPERPVVCLQGDGGAMYTLQALWTQAREGLNVTTIIFSNRKYQILEVELWRLGFKAPGARTLEMVHLGRPDLDWVGMAGGMGVHAARAESAETFNTLLARAFAEPGPHLIEAVL